MNLTKQMVLSVLAGALLHFTVNAQDKSDSAFKPSGNLWGYVFGDFAYKMNNDTLQRGGGNVQYRGTNCLSSNNTSANTNVPANVQTNAFQIRRAYLGYDYQFAPKFSATAVLANEQTLLPNGQNTVYLKYAFVKWSNIFKNSDLLIGQYGTCSFASAFGTEPLWSYRSVERTIMDMHNNDGSTDLGVSLQGKLWTQKTSDDKVKPMMLGYFLQAGNGSSAVPESDIFKKIRANVYAALLDQKLTIGIYGDYWHTQLSPYHTSSMTMKFYASYKTEKFRIGAEFFQQTNSNSDISKKDSSGFITPSAKNDTTSGVQMGWSVFASAKIVKKLNVFARYDMYDPNTKFSKDRVYSKVFSGIQGSNLTSATFYTQSFLTAGLDWTPMPRIHIMPNIWYNSYMSKVTTTGPSGTGNQYGERVKADKDMVYRVTFYFLFNGTKKVSNNGMDI